MSELENTLKEAFKGKRVLITGHTGFKGSWLSILLHKLGADVYGYALNPPSLPNLFEEARVGELVKSYIADIRDYKSLVGILQEVKPQIVIHMAAQPIVRESYINPIETYSTNVMGTVNLFEAIRHISGVKAVINVTTDKCYDNREWYWGYREIEPLGGFDPYSNSKGCSELVTSSFRNSFFNPKYYTIHGVAIATARAGNVIGGGDWAVDRLIPDFMRAISNGKKLVIRSPNAFRPWQHVLEPLLGYLILASRLLSDGPKYSEAWNFGPDDVNIKNVEWIAKTLCQLWGDNLSYEIDVNLQPYEARYLKLDCSKAKMELNWFPLWDIQTTLENVVQWNKDFLNGLDARRITQEQIDKYFDWRV
jgi:CDP-glucose 4,6-dehydratase